LKTGKQPAGLEQTPLTEEQLAQQAEDDEILIAFFDDGLLDEDDLFDNDAEFL